jgi:hypothetical protein
LSTFLPQLITLLSNSTFFSFNAKNIFLILQRDGVDDRYQTAEYTHASGSHEAQLANKNIMGGAMPASQAQKGLALIPDVTVEQRDTGIVDGQGVSQNQSISSW